MTVEFNNIKKILILGSGPIVIGQACEFDYSGTQACKSLMELGYEVILINSNPATIMTDPELATRVYIEPLQVPFVEKIIEAEKPDAILPTLGGQTALNLALELNEKGVLAKHRVALLGADPQVIQRCEDREEFRAILDEIGAKYPKSDMVRSYEAGMEAAEKFGFPIILRPNYTLGGGGGGIAYSLEEYQEKLAQALHESPTTEVLVEESILGWKEFELEIMRDIAGTFVIVCSIENFDACGVHTGDSITVAPQQTLTDRQYQDMRDEALKITEKVGIATGGANIQFAVDPVSGQRVVIEMNPRVSRSSALASKATGFPIAKIAAMVAVGKRLDEITNDITKTTPCCYEPALDYVVTKIPRFAFEKFTGSKDLLSTQMKSVGEVMAIGRTFKESLQKAVLSMESDPKGAVEVRLDEKMLTYPNSKRLFHIYQAFRDGLSVEDIHAKTAITPWFLEQLEEIVQYEAELKKVSELSKDVLLRAKRLGYSDAAIGFHTGRTQKAVKDLRDQYGIRPCFFQVDTCAGEFASETPYYYSTYWSQPEPTEKKGKSVVLLGSGPNRIGQGIEFDYSCVRTVKGFQKQGYRSVMINSNPETVSTDYDTSDELYFEPLTYEHIREVLERIQPEGFVAQVGGQTPISVASDLELAGFRILGTSMDSIDLAEDRAKFAEVCRSMDFKIPESGMAKDVEHALEIAERIGFPIVCRPSYVLGGRRMEVVEDNDDLKSYFDRHGAYITATNPCLMDQFLDRALEVDVDLVRGADWSIVGGIVEHIEAAGVHSGDSMGVIPPQRLRQETSEKIEELSHQLAEKLGIVGFLNLQLAVKNDQIYMLEANPRSSRSLPFIAKATGIPMVDLAVLAMLGVKKDQINLQDFRWRDLPKVSVKGVVFPFKKFPEADSILGPEMKSTGESMGRGDDYAEALLKAFLSSHVKLPKSGEVFMSLRDKDKDHLLPLAKELIELGYTLSATGGTADYLGSHGLTVKRVNKVHEGRPHCVDRIRSGNVSLVINTTSGREAIEASFGIRRSCVDYSIPCLTESDAAKSFLMALNRTRKDEYRVSPMPMTTPIQLR